MNSASVNHISECFIKPMYEVEDSKHPYYLAPLDLAMLSLQYIQEGLMFVKPSHYNDQEFSIHHLLDALKHSLSLTLVHFYPLAGQLATKIDEDEHNCLVFVDCNKGPGARFVHSTLDMTISDILSPADVPSVVHSFFDHNDAVNYDGHTRPLLSVQVTELVDGVFLGCSINHSVVDGTSYWHFWNSWSEIHTANEKLPALSRPPVHNRWFPDGYGRKITLPFTNPDEVITRHEETGNREKIFHFSSQSIAKLKAKAREESKIDDISSLQALVALVWRSIVRAKSLPDDEVYNCALVANDRHRLNPPLPKYYFGACINFIYNKTTSKELLDNCLGWATSLLHQSVAEHDDKAVRDCVNKWMESRLIYQSAEVFNPRKLVITHSPRFDMYGNEFGIGKAVAVRSGFGYKFDGVVAAYPGCEGGGSIDLEVCLSSDSMKALELDEEFMNAAFAVSNTQTC